MKIILIRHGMTEGNLKRRYIGTTDEDLINTDCLKGDYPKCERVVASPLKRCIQTAEYIYPNVDIEICDKLKECDFGDFENKSYEDLKDNPDYQRNVTALTSVLPPKLEAGDISARIGVSWVDVEDYQALTALSLTKPTTTRTVLWYRR